MAIHSNKNCVVVDWGRGVGFLPFVVCYNLYINSRSTTEWTVCYPRWESMFPPCQTGLDRLVEGFSDGVVHSAFFCGDALVAAIPTLRV